MEEKYDFWIDFKNREIYRFAEDIPQEIKNNFIDVKPEKIISRMFENLVLCSSNENYQHYTVNYPYFSLIVDWRHHRWSNDGEMLLNNLSIDEVFTILKEKNKTTSELLWAFDTQFDHETAYETIDYLLDDNVSYSEASDC